MFMVHHISFYLWKKRMSIDHSNWPIWKRPLEGHASPIFDNSCNRNAHHRQRAGGWGVRSRLSGAAQPTCGWTELPRAAPKKLGRTRWHRMDGMKKFHFVADNCCWFKLRSFSDGHYDRKIDDIQPIGWKCGSSGGCSGSQRSQAWRHGHHHGGEPHWAGRVFLRYLGSRGR